ncbi:MAG: hypothetical protein EOP06_18865, partial [Proteobacteria bacterium]
MSFLKSAAILSFLTYAIFISPVIANAAEDLETDQGFFAPGRGAAEDDDLDRATKNAEIMQSKEQLKMTDITIKDEIGSSHPRNMSVQEARNIDQKIAAENQKRKAAIFRTLA